MNFIGIFNLTILGLGSWVAGSLATPIISAGFQVDASNKQREAQIKYNDSLKKTEHKEQE